jgi:hypothetical protein
MLAVPDRSLVDTTWDVARDAQAVISELKTAKTVKTEIRVFFVGENHWVLFDQERRHAVAKGLKGLGKTAQPVHTIVERGLQVDTNGLPNVYREQAGMHATFDMRNDDVCDGIIDALEKSHTLPDFVILFGSNHETGIKSQMITRINDHIRDGYLTERNMTAVSWRSWRPIDEWITDEQMNIAWKTLVQLNDDSFLGFVDYDSQCIDHNMLLAEKCVVKTKFFVELRTRALLRRSDYWELYAARNQAGQRAIAEVRKALYVGETKLEIRSVDPSLIIRAFRKENSPRKKEWTELGKPPTG